MRLIIFSVMILLRILKVSDMENIKLFLEKMPGTSKEQLKIKLS